MKTKLHTFVLLFLAIYTFSQNQIGAKIVFSEAKANFGQVAAINNNGDFLISSAAYQFSTDQKGFARVYNFQNNNWTQVGNDLIGNTNGDTFGLSVAMNETGNTVAVGAIQLNDGNYSGPGYVKVFRFSSGQYVQIGNDIIGETTGDNFGRNISINGDGTKIIIGAIFNDANTGNQFSSNGHIRVYEFNGTNWNLMGTEIDGDMPNDNFGDSVDISKDGNRIVASASGFDSGGVNKGLVRVFQFSGGGWSKVGSDIIGTADNDRLTNVGISDDGNRISLRTKGVVKVLEYNGSQWVQLGNDITGLNNDIGSSNIDNTGNLITVASRLSNSNTGYIQLYQYNNTTWSQVGNTITGDVSGDNLGTSVEVKNGYVVAGSSDFNLNTEDNGGVRVYNFNTSLSIETTKFSNDVSLFPNPTTDQISIKGVQVKNITVFNLNGQQIFSSSKETISIKDFPKGMYLLKIIDLKGKTIYRKIIKN
jgi:hypothetical protein